MVKTMLFSGNSIWVFPWSFILYVLDFLHQLFFRSYGGKSVENGSIFHDFTEKSDPNSEGNDGEKMGCDKIEETEVKSVCNASSTSKYQFITGSSVCAFIEEPQTMNFTVKEMFVISHEQSLSREDSFDQDHGALVEYSGFSPGLDDPSFSDDLEIDSSPLKVDYSGVPDDLGDDSCNLEYNDCDELSEEKASKQKKTDNQDKILEKEDDQTDNLVEKIEFCEENRPSLSDSDDFWASIHKYDDISLNYDYDEVLLYDQTSIETLLEPETPIGIGDMRADYNQDSPRSIEDFLIDQMNTQLDEINQEPKSPYIELIPESYSSNNYKLENHTRQDEFSDTEDNESDQKSLKMSGINGLDDEEDDQTVGNDVVVEQKELIRQMKREMRQLKISGLPTILEESESLRVEEDLRPLKIDEKVRHKDRMDAIQTFYRRYLDKMRKLDILSQQTMYAIGLLHLKNQDLALNKRVTVPVIKSLLAQNFWSNKHKKQEAEPVQKLIRDLQRDLELAYVGQLCLSWEMLKWQHNKAQELQAHDPDGFRQHNQVAGDFQKFQVLLQRFTEDEPFHQGPRVQHYVKTRCNLPGLLQVPLIKDDPTNEWRRNEEDGISVKMLKEVIASSMRAFWDFLRADKDEICAIPLMGIHGVHQVILQDPSDADLLAEIRSSLQKKEKRLKDFVRSGNCLVKKFQKHQDQRLSLEMLVAQVELRLVSRVLSMPKLTTDQLLWCHKKLNKIDIIGRKIYLEYSFLLFPC